jgi:anti-sigma factor RsiW
VTGRITESELQAYIDGQLDMERRVEVEAHLASHPHDAAVVMRDMQLRDELRLFLVQPEPIPSTTVALSRKLSAWLTLRALLPSSQTAAVASVALAVGWFAHGLLSQPWPMVQPALTLPDQLAEDAAQAWHVAQAEPVAGSATVTTEIVAPGSGIPGLLAAGGFRRVGGNLIPWSGGTAMLDLLVSPKGEELVLLSAPMPSDKAEAVEAKLADGVMTVSWSRGTRAYAISGPLPTPELLSLAHRIDPAT